MLRRQKRLLFLALLISSATLYWGCSQPEDILTDKTQTILDLRAERLPTTPAGMYYELWVADTLIDDSVHGAVSIGKFTYNFDTYTYYDENGVLRDDSSRFILQADIYDYQWLFITVQSSDGSGPEVGAVMLIDTISDPTVNLLDLTFPLTDTLWVTAIEFNMETASDGRHPSTDGAGIWFTMYAEREAVTQDTIRLSSWRIDTIWKTSFSDLDGDCVTSIVDILNDRDTVKDSIYGFDTVQWTAIIYDIETIEVCDDGTQDSLLTTSVTLQYQTRAATTLTYDAFTQTAVETPDLSSYGWILKGWVVSSVIENLGVSIGDMTPPAWHGLNIHDSLIHGIDGGLLTTGTIADFYLPDNSNPYVDDPIRVPPYPGEDFMKNLPGGQDVVVNLVPSGNVPTGTVFISIEPILYTNDTTNFPLILMISELPSSRYEVEDDMQAFPMWNMMRHANDDYIGLPLVHVSIQRY